MPVSVVVAEPSDGVSASCTSSPHAARDSGTQRVKERILSSRMARLYRASAERNSVSAVRSTITRISSGSLALVLVVCQPTSEIPVRTEGQSTPTQELAADDVNLIRFACEGFDAAVAADAPNDRLLSHTAAHAVELGGPAVELATRRWALLPPQALLEEIDRYEQAGADPEQCAGLRSHLERLAILAGSQ